jgi:hypothetical protein
MKSEGRRKRERERERERRRKREAAPTDSSETSVCRDSKTRGFVALRYSSAPFESSGVEYIQRLIHYYDETN